MAKYGVLEGIEFYEKRSIIDSSEYDDIYDLIIDIYYNIHSWSLETAEGIFLSLRKISMRIEEREFKEHIYQNYSRDKMEEMSTILTILKYATFNEFIRYSRLINEFEKNKSELNKIKNIEMKKYLTLLSGKRKELLITLDRTLMNIKKIGAGLLYYSTKLVYFGQDIWLVGERSDQAEDNGYVFFKYCRENYPNRKIYYIIEKNSPHLSKLNDLGNVIYRDSFKHKLYLMHAKKLISAYHFLKFSTPSDYERFTSYFMKYVKGEKIFLQHGVTMNKPYSLNKHVCKYDYIVIPTSKEKNLFTTEYKYDEKQLLETGMARFDNLINLDNKKKKTILFMPTWRSDIKNLSEKEFKNTEYFNSINNLLTNIKLRKLLNKNNITLIFYLHYEMQKFLNCFDTNFDNIEVKDIKNSIVQELLKECSLLITDFSSVGCDFSYMDKPVIFYQFSEFNFHYDINKDDSYNTYKDFGRVVYKEKEVISLLEKWVKSRFYNFHKMNSNIYFYKNNRENCKRIFEAINNLPKLDNKKQHEVEINDDNGILIERRYYDKNYNFISRIYYRKDGTKRLILKYKDSYIYRGYLYDEKERLFGEYKYHKNILYKKDYFSVKENNKLISEYKQHKNGSLKYRIDYFNNGKTVKEIKHYNYDNGKLFRIKRFYSDGMKKEIVSYNLEGKAIEYFFYNKKGIKERYYTYHLNGKVKEKVFYDTKTRKINKKVKLSECDSSILETKVFN